MPRATVATVLQFHLYLFLPEMIIQTVATVALQRPISLYWKGWQIPDIVDIIPKDFDNRMASYEKSQSYFAMFSKNTAWKANLLIA